MNPIPYLSGLKTATDLLRSLRDALKQENLPQDQIAGRIGEIYDYIVDSKDALVEAKDQIQELKAEIKTLKDQKQLADTMDWDGHVWWLPIGDRFKGLYCPICWADNKLILLEQGRANQDTKMASYECHIRYTPS